MREYAVISIRRERIIVLLPSLSKDTTTNQGILTSIWDGGTNPDFSHRM